MSSSDVAKDLMSSTASRFDLFAKLADRLGFPAMVCSALLYGSWVLGDRVTTAHLATLRVVQESVTRQADAMENIGRVMEARTGVLEEMLQEQKRTADAVSVLIKQGQGI